MLIVVVSFCLFFILYNLLLFFVLRNYLCHISSLATTGAVCPKRSYVMIGRIAKTERMKWTVVSMGQGMMPSNSDIE